MKNSQQPIFPPSTRAPPARFAFALPWLACGRALVLASSVALAPAEAQTASPQNPAPTAVPAVPSSGAAPAAPASATSPLESLGWLHGCWDGKVNQRDFREEWLPLRGDMMIGVSHTVSQGKTQDFEYLRIEARPQGLHYVTAASGQKEATFRFDGATRDEINPADIFTLERRDRSSEPTCLSCSDTSAWLLRAYRSCHFPA